MSPRCHHERTNRSPPGHARSARAQDAHPWTTPRLGDLQAHPAALDPALYRLEDAGFIEATWGISAEGKRAKIYALTTLGKKQFAKSQNQWKSFLTAVEHVLSAT
jgi:hypothetical protein